MQDKELNISDLTQGISRFVQKNWLFLLGFILLGLIIGFLRFQRAKPAYQTNVYAKSTFIPIELLKNEVSSVNALIEEGNYTKLADGLGLDSSQVRKYVSVNFFDVSDDERIFSIQVKSTGSTNPNQAMIVGIAAYLETNEFLKKYLEVERERIDYNDEIYKAELANLLSIQEGIVQGGKLSNYTLISDPGTLSKEIVDFKKLIKNNELRRDELVAYNVIDSVNIVTSPSLKKSLLSSVIVFLFLGSFCLITWRLFTIRS